MWEIPKSQMRKAIRRSPYSHGEITYVLDDQGTTVITPVSKSQVEWRAYTGYKETANLFVLFSSDRYGLIPKRVMLPDEVGELRNLLNLHITSSRACNGAKQ